jgi:ribonuclease D
MNIYTKQTNPIGTIRIIETETELTRYLARLHETSISVLALDLEGDQGRYRYKSSISIFQCFDGKEAVIIDVLRMGASPSLQELLTTPRIVKVMFSCNSDMYMTQNILGYSIDPVRDIAVAQKLLGQEINLSSYLKIEKKLKDTYQKSNWLLRPLQPGQLEYAVNDVLELLKIENELTRLLQENGKYADYLARSAKISATNYRLDPNQAYTTRFPHYERFTPAEKDQAKLIWIFREVLGEHLDKPVGYMLSRGSMLAVLRSGHPLPDALEEEMNRHRNKNKISRAMVDMLYEKTLQRTGTQR